jgi:hypothetical protein
MILWLTIPSPWIDEGDTLDFNPGSAIPPHFTYWRFPIEGSFAVSPANHSNSLRLQPSTLNLTALNGNYAGPIGQTFIGRRQQDTLFTFGVTLDFAPTIVEEEAGVSAFLTQNHHIDMGVVMLPASAANSLVPNTNTTIATDKSKLITHFRFRAISYVKVPDTIVAPVPDSWVGKPLRLEIRASNVTHYSFSAGPADAQSEMRTIINVSNDPVSWGFTGEHR